jgi:apolipoprotein N-acyltransferase
MPILLGFLRLLACVASGVLLSLAFPPVNAGWVAWIALLPMIAVLWTVKGRRAGWKGFGLGLAAGLGFFFINVRWLATVAAVGPYALGGYLALYFALFGAFAASWGNPWHHGSSGWRGDLRSAFSNAAVWAGLEWMRGWFITGFGWNSVGASLHSSLVLAQAADLFSVLGLSLLMLLVQMLVLMAVRRFLRSEKRPALFTLAVAGVAMLGWATYGWIRLATAGKGESVPLRALLVQANLPQEGAMPLLGPEETNMAYEQVTGDALAPLKGTDRFPDWVVWPESALAGRLFSTDGDVWAMWEQNNATISQIRQYGEFSLLFGITELESVPFQNGLVQKEDGRAWNSMVVLDSQDSLQTFRKHHLVIFGETIPFVDTIPWLKDIYEQQSGMEYGGAFSAGESLEPLGSEVRGEKIGIIPSVCFEDTVPRLERKFVRPGPQIIVNVTNDGWFKESEAAEQHFVNAVFRSIELRRPTIRCANTGVSGSITEVGKTQRLVDANGSHFTSGSLLVEIDIPKNPPFSLYAILGDWPIILMGLGGLGIGFRNRRARVV